MVWLLCGCCGEEERKGRKKRDHEDGASDAVIVIGGAESCPSRVLPVRVCVCVLQFAWRRRQCVGESESCSTPGSSTAGVECSYSTLLL